MIRALTILFLSCLTALASPVTFTMSNQFGPDTNYIRLVKILPEIRADGSFQTVGIPFRIYPDAAGFVQTNLQEGAWVASNQFMVSQFWRPGGGGSSQGFFFAVDPSGTTNPFTRYPGPGAGVVNWHIGIPGIIGTNGFTVTTNGSGIVTLDGSLFTLSSNQIFNAFGFFPLSALQTTNAISGAVPTNFWSTSSLTFLSNLVFNAHAFGLVNTNDLVITSNALKTLIAAKQVDLGYTPATNSFSGIRAAQGFASQPTNGNLTGFGQLQTNQVASTNVANPTQGGLISQTDYITWSNKTTLTFDPQKGNRLLTNAVTANFINTNQFKFSGSGVSSLTTNGTEIAVVISGGSGGVTSSNNIVSGTSGLFVTNGTGAAIGTGTVTLVLTNVPQSQVAGLLASLTGATNYAIAVSNVQLALTIVTSNALTALTATKQFGTANVTNYGNRPTNTFAASLNGSSTNLNLKDPTLSGTSLTINSSDEINTDGSGSLGNGFITWDAVGGFSAATLAGDGSAIGNLDASKITQNTIALARLPVIQGVNLLDATNITVNGARLFVGDTNILLFTNSGAVRGDGQYLQIVNGTWTNKINNSRVVRQSAILSLVIIDETNAWSIASGIPVGNWVSAGAAGLAHSTYGVAFNTEAVRALGQGAHTNITDEITSSTNGLYVNIVVPLANAQSNQAAVDRINATNVLQGRVTTVSQNSTNYTITLSLNATNFAMGISNFLQAQISGITVSTTGMSTNGGSGTNNRFTNPILITPSFQNTTNQIFEVLNSTSGSSNSMDLTSGTYNSIIGQGRSNIVQFGAQAAVLAGGLFNRQGAAQIAPVIGGGWFNTNNGSSGAANTIGGGGSNNIINVQTSGATIPGGTRNTAAATQTFAAGYRAKAYHAGSFVWSDFQEADFYDSGVNQFLVRSSGGVGINTTNPGLFAMNAAGQNGMVNAGGFTINSNKFYSTNCVFASTIWPPDSSVEVGGGTSATAALQSVLDRVTNGLPLMLVIDGAFLLNNSNSLQVYSNTAMVGLNKYTCGFFLGTNNNCPLIQNYLNTNYSGKSLYFANFAINQNGTNQNVKIHNGGNVNGIPATTNIYTVAMWLAGVSNCVVENVNFINPAVFGLLFSSAYNMRMSYLDFDYRYVGQDGQDGIHFWGDGENIVIDNYTGNCTGDNIALNVSEDYQLVNPSPYWSTNICNLKNVSIDGVYIRNIVGNLHGNSVVNLQTGDNGYAKIPNITVKNVRAARIVNPIRTFGPRIGVAHLENWKLPSIESPDTISLSADTNLSLVNWYVKWVSSDVPMFPGILSFGGGESTEVHGMRADLTDFTGDGCGLFINTSTSPISISGVSQVGGDFMFADSGEYPPTKVSNLSIGAGSPILQSAAITNMFGDGVEVFKDINVRTITNNSLTVSRLIMSDGSKKEVSVTLGNQLALSGTTLYGTNSATSVFYTGQTNIGALATSLLIQIGHTMPNTNYTPAVSIIGSAVGLAATTTYTALTTTTFTVNLSAAVGADNMVWSVICSP